MREVTLKFLAQLRACSAASGLRRVDLVALWACYRDAGGYQAADGATRSDLSGILEELDAHHDLRLPSYRSKKAWDLDASGVRLPFWIRLPRAQPMTDGDGERGPVINHATHLWPRELDFIRTLRAPRPALIAAGLAIQCWLALPGSRQRLIVPVKERSLELFGHEKRLEALLDGELFKPGRLTLAHLRAERIPEPLTWEAGPASSVLPRSMLIVENLSTYLSFCRWNRQTGHYVAVAYGRGKLLRYLMQLIPRVIAQLQIDRIEYFGDVDAPGILFPLQARDELRVAQIPIPFEPAVRWYAAMLQRAQTCLVEVNDPGAWSDSFAEWFPTPMQDNMHSQFNLKQRLPQELIGLEYLFDQTYDHS